MKNINPEAEASVENFLVGKSEYSVQLFHSFVQKYTEIGEVRTYAAKTMIGIAGKASTAVYVTQFGKNFIHVVFPFSEAHYENLCFQKIAQVPGNARQFNHHFRMYLKEDLNDEVQEFMLMAYRRSC